MIMVQGYFTAIHPRPMPLMLPFSLTDWHQIYRSAAHTAASAPPYVNATPAISTAEKLVAAAFNRPTGTANGICQATIADPSAVAPSSIPLLIQAGS